MTEQVPPLENSTETKNDMSRGWWIAFGYDIFMMFIIIFNLFCLCANAFLMSNFGDWLFNEIHLPQVLQYYKNKSLYHLGKKRHIIAKTTTIRSYGG